MLFNPHACLIYMHEKEGMQPQLGDRKDMKRMTFEQKNSTLHNCTPKNQDLQNYGISWDCFLPKIMMVGIRLLLLTHVWFVDLRRPGWHSANILLHKNRGRLPIIDHKEQKSKDDHGYHMGIITYHNQFVFCGMISCLLA